MVELVEAALCLVNRSLLLCNFSWRPLGHLCKRIILYSNNRTLHLFYYDESLYVCYDFLGTRMEASVQFLWTGV
jgi:hypothetical protein